MKSDLPNRIGNAHVPWTLCPKTVELCSRLSHAVDLGPEIGQGLCHRATDPCKRIDITDLGSRINFV